MVKEKIESVRSLERGFKILECFTEHVTLSLTEISLYTDLSVTTCNRLVKTLVDMQYMEKNFQKKYKLGPKINTFLESMNRKNDIVEIANESLIRLKSKFNETSSMYLEQNVNRVCVAKVESSHALRRTVKLGEVLPLNRGAVGEVFLAYMSLEKKLNLLNKNIVYTDSFLEKIRKQGYSINDGIQEPGVYAIAAPVLDNNKNILSVISVSGPSDRIKKYESELIVEIKKEAEKLSKELIRYNKEN
jgi:transcriptional regulator, iclR family, C-terminal domain protein